MKLNGSQILLKSLKKAGIDTIFGYPGGSVLNIFDEMFKKKDIRFILTRHEQGAAHAADGYARSTGKIGCCMVTSGPGATNLVTGIATAFMDSIPMLCITGQVPRSLIGNDAFQEADVCGITRPITKQNYLLDDVRDIARITAEAVHVATSGRPGPVLIDIPKDLTSAQTEFNYPDKIDIRGYKPVTTGHSRQLGRVADMLARAKRPLFYGGGGLILSGASAEFTKTVHKSGIPVTLTLMGLGALPGTDPLFLGMCGMHGTVVANTALQECDVLVAVGARFDDRVTGKLSHFATGAKIVHIDIDPSAISKNVHVDVPVVGDAKDCMNTLYGLVKKCSIDPWIKRLETIMKQKPLRYEKTGTSIKPQAVVETIWELSRRRKTIITTEVGQNQMWAAQFYRFKRPRQLLTSGGLGTMGYGFPAAIGAQIGDPDALVVDIAGDGSIQMNIQELATAVYNDLPVKIVILNNGVLGMVRQWQTMFYGDRLAQTVLPDIPDFVKLAESYGAVGMRITKADQVRSALKEAFGIRKTVIMDFRVDPDENVLPMVPSGSAIHEMIEAVKL